MGYDSFYHEEDNQLLNMNVNLSLRRARPVRSLRRNPDSASTSPEAPKSEKTFRTSADSNDRIQRAQLVTSAPTGGMVEPLPIKRTVTTTEARLVNTGFIESSNIAELSSTCTSPSTRSPISLRNRNSSGSNGAPSSRYHVSPISGSAPTSPIARMALFLELQGQVKRVVFTEKMTMDGLRSQFLQRFASNFDGSDHDSGSLYMRDQETNIVYLLEDLSDVGNNSYLIWKPEEAPEKEEPAPLVTLPTSPAELKDSQNDTIIKDEMQSLRAVIEGLSAKLDGLSVEIAKNNSKNLHPPGDNKNTSKDTNVEEGPDSAPQGSIKSSSLSSSDGEEVAALKKELKQVRNELYQIREEKASLEKETESKIKALQDELADANKKIKSNPNARRSKLEEDLEHLKNTYNELGNQHADIESSMQLMRKDTTDRGVIPSQARMDLTRKELEYIENTSKELLKFIDDNGSIWKRTWESELHGIVQEQQFSKDAGKLIKELREDTKPLRELFNMLEKIVDLKTKQREAQRNGGEPSTPKFFDVVPAEEVGEVRNEMMSEIQCIEVNHERRLKALDMAIKSREKELANKVDEFEKELGDYVANQKLRKTGGTEELEKRLRKKEEEVLKAMLTSMAEASVRR
ncbi:Bud site selection protein 6 [Mycoemilia scoparia]|uniref:Bud site selection protein 6 n=1 Tax=Mycoemilia scoparia TaxID=417184 RepID=A0A9W7ZX71_9FUNG|nr:Bud site selection protein 6 [Mycoemilia scoparia]